MQIVWFKRDLRIQDHAPLKKALKESLVHGPVLCLFIHEPSLVARPDCARQHTEFARECLGELARVIRLSGGQLLEVVGEATAVFEHLHRFNPRRPITRIFAHEETTHLDGFARDRAVRAWAKSSGVAFHETAQNAVERGFRLEANGHDFKAHLERAVQTKPVGIEGVALGGAFVGELPFASAQPRDVPVGSGIDTPGRLKGGRAAAMDQLKRFGGLNKLAAYPGSVSSPNTAAEGCSRLSPYLSMGVLSDSEVLHHLQQVSLQAKNGAKPIAASAAKAAENGMQFFAQRLYWRAGYLQLMESHPQIELHGEVEALVQARLPRPGHGEYAAHHRFLQWAQGRTGVPMIDGAMRLLNATGWANFRLRGAVTSFALNELWLPHRAVALHLARAFLDFEPAIHYSQVAIHGGLLKGSRPLVYSATKQARDHDPKGEFIRKWVPELTHVPLEYLFEPWTMTESVQASSQCWMGADYPQPLVDVKAAHLCAKTRVYALWNGQADPGGEPHLANGAGSRDDEQGDRDGKKRGNAGKKAIDKVLAKKPGKSQLALF